MRDPLHQHTCLQSVRRLAESGTAVLVILHHLNLAARYCARLLLLEWGGAHAVGTPVEVLRAEPLKCWCRLILSEVIPLIIAR